jgi:transposase
MEVVVGIETDRGPWVQALVARRLPGVCDQPVAGGPVPGTSRRIRGESDAGDAHTLADMVRTDRHQLRPVAGDSDLAEAIKVLSRAHKSLVWKRTQHMLRLRQVLREFFPAALVAYEDLAASDTLQLLQAAPDPSAAAALGAEQIAAALRSARRRDVAGKTAKIQAALRTEHLGQPPVVAGAYAATVRAQVAILTVLNSQITPMQGR